MKADGYRRTEIDSIARFTDHDRIRRIEGIRQHINNREPPVRIERQRRGGRRSECLIQMEAQRSY